MDLYPRFPSAVPLQRPVDEVYRSPRRLAKLVTAAFVLEVGLLGMLALVLWDLLDVANAAQAGQYISPETIDGLTERSQNLDAIALGLLFACVLTFCLWTHRVAKNARALGVQLSITPGQAVGYYFVPIAQLWRPYAALVEVWDASGSPRRADVVTLWWMSFLASRLMSAFLSYGSAPVGVDAWLSQLHLSFIAIVLETLAAGLALVVVWRLTDRQDQSATESLPVARIA